jgi:hypothetical protein
MTQEHKTLRELNVQLGDVVRNRYETEVTISRFTAHAAIDTDGFHWQLHNPIWRIVSRASDTPKLLRDMTDAEIGALVRAHHEGKVIERRNTRGEWIEEKCPKWFADRAYRVRPEPKRETVTVHWGSWGFTLGHGPSSRATHRITFDLVDGEPDPNSIKMEEI